MDELEKARLAIDEADKALVHLFEKRMDAVRTVASYKAKHGLPVFDEKREKEVREKALASLSDASLRSYCQSVLDALTDSSKQYQKKLLSGRRIAYCGTDGAFSLLALKRIFPDTASQGFPDFAAAYRAVEDGRCDACVLPMENSYAGEVGQVTDLMFAGELFVSGIYELSVRHTLLGVKGAKKEDIRTVISHPQALSQCAGYIREHSLATESAQNTAFAAQKAAELHDRSIAAIAGEQAAELYSLEVLDRDLCDSPSNTTRFAVFSAADSPAAESGGSMILLFTVNDEIGALAKAVNIIAAHGYNLRVLRSRPVKNTPWQYYFYAQAEGSGSREDEQRMLRALSVCCERLKTVGHFPCVKTV